jgi:WD40 repeat protein/tetratricopeptide (TPR) repeat protein
LAPALVHTAAVTEARFVKQGGTTLQVLTVTERGTVRLWEAATGRPLTPPLEHDGPVRYAGLVYGGLFTAGGTRVQVWDILAGRPASEPLKLERPLSRVVSPPPRSLYSREFLLISGKEVRRSDPLALRSQAKPSVHDQEVTGVWKTDQGGTLLTAAGNTARVWPVHGGTALTPPLVHPEPVVAGVVLSVPGRGGARLFVVTLTASKVWLWDGTSGKPLAPASAHGLDQPSVGFVTTHPQGPAGRHGLVVAGAGGVWRSELNQLHAALSVRLQRNGDLSGLDLAALLLFEKLGTRTTSFRLSPDGRLLATTGTDGCARLWDAATGKPLGKPLVHDGSPSYARFSAGGRRLLTAIAVSYSEMRVRVWDVATGKPLISSVRVSPGQPSAAPAAHFSSDGRRLLLGIAPSRPGRTADPEMQVWDLETGHRVTELHRRLYVLGTLSPDGRYRIAGAMGGVRVFDNDTGKPVTPVLLNHFTRPAVFSPDGRCVLTSDGKAARVWETATGNPLTPPLQDPTGVTTTGFTTDGLRIVTLGERWGRTWDLAPDPRPLEELLLLAQVLAGRRIDEAGSFVPLDGAEWRNAWEKLQDHPALDNLLLLGRGLVGRDFDEGGRFLPLDSARWSRADSGSWDMLPVHQRAADIALASQDWHTARVHLAAALTIDPAQPLLRYRHGLAAARLRRWVEALADFDRAAKQGVPAEMKGESWQFWAERASVLAELGRWPQAAADLERAASVPDAPQHLLTWRALLALKQGDGAGFRQASAAMAKRLGNKDDGGPLNNVAWACALGPGAGADVAALAERLGKVVARDPPNRNLRNTLGAILYRAGKFDAAVAELEESIALHQHGGSWEDWIFLALAEHHRGHADLAHEWLRRTAEGAPRTLGQLKGGPAWHQRAEAETLLREAQALLRTAPPPAAPPSLPGGRLVVAGLKPLTSVAVSADGKLALTGGFDHMPRLWVVENGKEVRSFAGHTHDVWSVALSPDGKYALSGSADRTVRLWNTADGRELHRFTTAGTVSCVRFSPDGRLAAATGWDRIVRLWEVPGGKKVREMAVPDLALDLAFTPDGKQFLLGTLSGTLLLCATDSGKIVRKFPGHTRWVHGVAVSADGKRGLSAGRDGTLRQWDIDSGKELLRCTGHAGPLHEAAFLPSGDKPDRLLSTGDDGTIRVWDAQTGKELYRCRGHSAGVRGRAVTADGRVVLGAGLDGALRRWEVPR